MRSAPIVDGQIAVQTDPLLRDTAIGTQIDFLVLDRLPQPFDHDIVAPRTLAVHANRDLNLLQGREKSHRGELAALIRVHDLRLAMPRQGVAQRLHARPRLQRNREPSGKHLAAEPVADRHQIHEPTGHGHIRDVDRPHVVRSGDGQMP